MNFGFWTPQRILLGVALVVAYSYYCERRNAREGEAREKEIEEIKRKIHVDYRDDWSLDEVKKYNGEDQGEPSPLLVAIDGDVYNVWHGYQYYGPGGSYHCFLNGKDAYRLFAKGILDESEDDGAILTLKEKGALEDWKSHFQSKYVHVGRLRKCDQPCKGA